MNIFSFKTSFYFLLCAVFTACVGLPETPLVQTPDLSDDLYKRNGEGLAKPSAKYPVLVNNTLLYQSMGDVVLGIAMAVGGIKNTIVELDKLALPDINSMATSRYLEWQSHTDIVVSPSVIEPYVYALGTDTLRFQLRVNICYEDDCKLLDAEFSEPMSLKDLATAEGVAAFTKYLDGSFERVLNTQLK